jgi:hypothetical protein
MAVRLDEAYRIEAEAHCRKGWTGHSRRRRRRRNCCCCTALSRSCQLGCSYVRGLSCSREVLSKETSREQEIHVRLTAMIIAGAQECCLVVALEVLSMFTPEGVRCQTGMQFRLVADLCV